MTPVPLAPSARARTRYVERHALWRELFTGLKGPAATIDRLRLFAWVHLLVIIPLIYVPTLLEGIRFYSVGRVDISGVGLLWVTGAVLVLVSNICAAIGARRGDSWSRVIYLATIVSLLGDIACTLLSTYPIGLITSSASFYLAIAIAFYRVGLDYKLGLIATLASVGGYLFGVCLEVFGFVPLHPSLPEAVLPHYDIDVTPWAVVIPSCIGMMLLFAIANYSVNQSLELHRYITNSVLRRYLPPSMVDRAALGELHLDSPPERRTVTVVFADLVGFTQLSERLEPDQLARVINNFLSRVADIAHRHGATIDKFVGDCAMLVLGAPDDLPVTEQAVRAVAIAREIVTAVSEPIEGVEIKARVGINTGEATVGNFGSPLRSDYTVIGPVVNVASRLESSGWSGRVLLGEQTAEHLDPTELGEWIVLELKGVSAPVRACFLAV